VSEGQLLLVEIALCVVPDTSVSVNSESGRCTWVQSQVGFEWPR